MSPIPSGKSSGTRVLQGFGRTGTLAQVLTTGDTTLHIKAGPGATFSPNDDLLVESPGGSSGETFTFAQCSDESSGGINQPYEDDGDGTLCQVRRGGAYTPGSCTNSGPAFSREACENFVVLVQDTSISSAVNTHISLGCSAWELDCHAFVRPMDPSSVPLSISETTSSRINGASGTRMHFNDISSAISWPEDFQTTENYEYSSWRMKWTISFVPTTLLRSMSYNLQEYNSPLLGYVKQGDNQRAIARVGRIRYFVVFTLTGDTAFGGSAGFTEVKQMAEKTWTFTLNSAWGSGVDQLQGAIVTQTNNGIVATGTLATALVQYDTEVTVISPGHYTWTHEALAVGTESHVLLHTTVAPTVVVGDVLLDGRVATLPSDASPTTLVVHFTLDQNNPVFPSTHAPSATVDIVLNPNNIPGNPTIIIPHAQITAVTYKTMNCFKTGQDPCNYDSFSSSSSQNQNWVHLNDEGTLQFETEATDLSATGGDMIFYFGNQQKSRAITIKSVELQSVTSSAITTTPMYVACGANNLVAGSLKLLDLSNKVNGFYMHRCSRSGVVSVEASTFQNGAQASMTELLLDDTDITSPPDVSMLTNLERLSIAGDKKPGRLTTLPDISNLINLKFFNVSKNPNITSIPAGYFDNNIHLEEIVMEGNGISEISAGIFDRCTKLKILNFRGNKLQKLSDATLPLPLLEILDFRDNVISVNQSTPLSLTYFQDLLNLKELLLGNNKVKYFSKHHLIRQFKLTELGSQGDENTFARIRQCPPGYYATQTFLGAAGKVFYTCDPCTMPSLPAGGDAFACWTNFQDLTTHFSPKICPRGFFCPSTSKTQTPCPAGKYNLNEGVDVSSGCINCEDGFYNPLEGQSICPFQCAPGTYGDHRALAASGISFCKACKIGNFCFGQGVVTPVQCPSGKYSDEVGLVSGKGCKDCPTGYYSSDVELTSVTDCQSCPPGKTSIQGSSVEQNCVGPVNVCPNFGERASVVQKTRFLKCEKCEAGKFGEDKIACRLCPAGFVGSSKGASNCDEKCTADLCAAVPGATSQAEGGATLPEEYSFLMNTSLLSSIDAVNMTDLDNRETEVGKVDIDESTKYALYLSLLIPPLGIVMLHRYFPMGFKIIDVFFAGSNYIDDTVSTLYNFFSYSSSFAMLALSSFEVCSLFFSFFLIFFFFPVSSSSKSLLLLLLPLLFPPSSQQHSLRMMDSRLGASFSLAMPFILVILAISVYFEVNSFETATMVPKNSANLTSNEDNIFGSISLRLRTAAFRNSLPQEQQSCTQISLVDNALLVNCMRHESITDDDVTDASKELLLCSIHLSCKVSNKVTGRPNVKLSFPKSFQVIQWSIEPDKSWNYQRTQVMHTLRPTTGVLSGTRATPSMVDIQLLRGKYDNFRAKTKKENQTDYGIQLAWAGSTLVQPDDGGGAGNVHYVSFQFDVNPLVLLITARDIKDQLSLVITVLTLFLSVIAGVKGVKMMFQLVIDNCLMMRAKRYNEPAPNDVVTRMQVLKGIHESGVADRRVSSDNQAVYPLDTSSTTIEMVERGQGASSSSPSSPTKSKSVGEERTTENESGMKDLRREMNTLKVIIKGLAKKKQDMEQRLDAEKEDMEKRMTREKADMEQRLIARLITLEQRDVLL